MTKEEIGAALLGVAVLDEPVIRDRMTLQRAAIDDAVAYAGGAPCVLVTTDPSVLSDRRWTVVCVGQDIIDQWRDIAARHLGACEWVLYVPVREMIERGAVLEAMRMAVKGKASRNLVKLAKDEAPMKPQKLRWNGSDEVLAAMLVTPEVKDLADESATRWRKYAGGIPLMRFDVETADPYKAKLLMLQAAPRKRVILVDADLWLLRETPFQWFIRECFEDCDYAGVVDRGAEDHASFVGPDCEVLRIPPGRYINTGLVLLDLGRPAVLRAIDHALVNYDRKAVIGVRDFGEQSLLNSGLVDAGAEFAELPPSWNFYMHAVIHGYGQVPAVVHGLHAAGIPLRHKLARLREQAAVFGFAVGGNKEPGAGSREPATTKVKEPVKLPVTNVHRANNDASLGIGERTDRALDWLRRREELRDFLGFEGLASCKCFLTYRACDGLLEHETWRVEVKPLETGIPAEHPLAVRWEISQRTAEVYLAAITGDVDAALFQAVRLVHQVAKQPEWLDRWQPMVCNVVRVGTLAAYLHYLRGDATGGGAMIELVVNIWKKVMGAVDWIHWPLRFAEMGDDRHALLNAMVIARACGQTKFPNHDWLKAGQLNAPTVREHPYKRLMRELGRLNPEKCLWT